MQGGSTRDATFNCKSISWHLMPAKQLIQVTYYPWKTLTTEMSICPTASSNYASKIFSFFGFWKKDRALKNFIMVKKPNNESQVWMTSAN